MDEPIRRTIEAVHASPCRCVLAVAGAGGEAIAWLLGVPGASGTVLEAVVPYAHTALAEFLGGAPARFVSAATAAAMAERSYRRAEHLRDGDYPLLGVGCTAALATTRPRRGADRVHVCVRAADAQATYSLEMARGARTREEEEDLCSRLLVHALALACGVLPAHDLPLLPCEQVRKTGEMSPVADLLAGRASSLLVQPDGRTQTNAAPADGVLPGAFNPLHDGHRLLARAAAAHLGQPVTFELSLRNVDKPPLSEEEALRRARQFRGSASLALTRAPTFREKARLFPGCTFIIGYDTAVRVVAPDYYAGPEDMLAALAEIRDHGCRFLVAGRLANGAFHTLSEAPIPEEFRPLFDALPPSAFRLDISSTELRTR